MLFLCAQNFAFAQQAKIITAKQFEDMPYGAELIEGYPQNKMPENVLEVYLHIDPDNSIAQLIYKLPNSYKIYPEIKAVFLYNWAKRIGAEYKNGLIEISSALPYSSTIVTGVFKVQGNQLFFVKEIVYNPDEDTEKSADDALAAGDIKKAAELYAERSYPPIDYYVETQKKLLKRAHEIAMQQNKAKEYKKAAETMGYAYSFWDIDEKSPIFLDTKVSRIIADYTYFLQKAKMYNKCIEVAGVLTGAVPDMAGPYLQLGDSYYHTNQGQKALEAYKTYSDLRKKQGQEQRIPGYVKNRITELESTQVYAWSDFLKDCEIPNSDSFDTREFFKFDKISQNQAIYIRDEFRIEESFIYKPVAIQSEHQILVIIAYDYDGALAADLFVFDVNGNFINRKVDFLRGNTSNSKKLEEYALVKNMGNDVFRSVNKRLALENNQQILTYLYFEINDKGAVYTLDYPKDTENLLISRFFNGFQLDYFLSKDHDVYKLQNLQNGAILVKSGKWEKNEDILNIAYTQRYGTKGVGNYNSDMVYEHFQPYKEPTNETEKINWREFLKNVHLGLQKCSFSVVSKDNPTAPILSFPYTFDKSKAVEISRNFYAQILNLPIEYPGRDAADKILAKGEKYIAQVYAVGNYFGKDNTLTFFYFIIFDYGDNSYLYEIDAFITKNGNFLHAINVYSGATIDKPVLIDENGNFVVTDDNYGTSFKISIDGNGQVDY